MLINEFGTQISSILFVRRPVIFIFESRIYFNKTCTYSIIFNVYNIKTAELIRIILKTNWEVLINYVNV